MASEDLSELLVRVAEATTARNMESEDWTKAVAIEGLLSTGDDQYVAAARRLIDRSIETQTSAGYLSYGSHDPIPPEILDPVEWPDYGSHQWQCHGAAVGRGVLEFYERTGDDRYLEAAKRQYEALESAVRTEDGGLSYNSVRPELWVDSLYMVPPFLAKYAAATGTDAAFDEAVHEIEVQADRLQDDDAGLFRHIWRETPNSYPEGTFWSRGNGWAITGILDTLASLPDDHPGRESLVDTFEELAAAIRPFQDESGFWHNILDDPTSPLETSGTLMFAYAFERGVERGLLDEAYRTAAEAAMDVCEGVVDDGVVTRVAMPPGGPGVPLGSTSYGQGWFLLAASAFLEDRQ